MIEMKGEGTISSVVEDNLCTGCGTCVALCPNEAIEMVIDEKKGIYVPELDGGKCNNCGICFKVCPGHEVDFKGLNLEIFGKEPEDILIGNYLNCYVGHATDHDIRYNSASGGLVTALLIFAREEGLIDGALVTRMKKDKPLEPEPFIARTREEIIEARGSKYCPVPANVALRGILEAEEGERFAVVGLPCHVHGLRKAQRVNAKLRDRVVLCFGIFCSTTKSFLATEFQFNRMKIKKKEVVDIRYRGEGWPGCMTVDLKNNQKFSELHPIYYDDKFCSFTPWRCTMCVDETSELADISFGDAWLPELTQVDNVGTSIIIYRNELCGDILRQMIHEKLIKLELVDISKVSKSQGGFQRKKYFKPRCTVSKFLFNNKKTPNYNNQYNYLPQQTTFYDYITVILPYLKNYLAFRRNLWVLLNVYCMLLSYLKSKLRL